MTTSQTSKEEQLRCESVLSPSGVFFLLSVAVRLSAHEAVLTPLRLGGGLGPGYWDENTRTSAVE